MTGKPFSAYSHFCTDTGTGKSTDMVQRPFVPHFIITSYPVTVVRKSIWLKNFLDQSLQNQCGN